MILALSLAVVALMAFLVAMPRFGVFASLFSLCVFTMAVLPRVLLGGQSEDAIRVSISGSQPRLFTYTVAILLVLVMSLFRAGVRGRAAIVIVPLIYLMLWSVFVWDNQPETWSGILHLSTALLAFVAGARLRSVYNINDSNLSLSIVRIILAVVVLQTVLTGLQFAGLGILDQDDNLVAEDLSAAGRASGTFAHPAVLGKSYIFLLLFLLPFTQVGDKQARKLAWVAISLMPVGLVFTEARANFAAFLAALLLWVMFSSRKLSAYARFMVPMGIVAIAVASADIWLERFTSGENGEYRRYFSSVARDWLSTQNPWAGVGPGNYVEALASFDPWVAAGWPVHNIFLYGAVELGVVGVALLFLPAVAVLVRAARGWRTRDPEGSSMARAVLAISPGLFVVCITGWGMLAEMLPLWFFAFGWAWRTMSSVNVASRVFGDDDRSSIDRGLHRSRR